MQYIVSLVGNIPPWLILIGSIICYLIIILAAATVVATKKSRFYWQSIRIIISVIVMTLVTAYWLAPSTNFIVGIISTLYAAGGTWLGQELVHAPLRNDYA